MAAELGIDLGTSSTLIYMKGKGIVLDEPSVIAISETSGDILSIGIGARDMLGRTPGGIRAVRPIREGVIANFDMTVSILKEFMRKSVKSMVLKPRVVICVPSCVTEVEKRAVKEAAMSAGAKEVYLIEEAMAAAVGAGLDVEKPIGSMIINIGGGTTEIAVISLGGIVTAKSLKVAGNAFDSSIIQYIKRKYNIMIGDISAEDVKIKIGSACPLKEETSMNVRGRDLISGLPKTITVSSEEIREALAENIEQIVDAVKATLEQTPPELAADVIDNGIVIAGGGAVLKGLGKVINKFTDIPVYIAESPRECVVTGAGKTLEELKTLRNILLQENIR